MPPVYHSRVLFFHGFTQTSSIFYAKTSALRKKLIKLGYKCIYLNGPSKLTPAQFPSNDVLSKFGSIQVEEDGESNLRGWWIKASMMDKTIKAEDAIETINQYIKENTVIEDEDFQQDLKEEDKQLPITGLIGFSQGAAVAGLLMNKFKTLYDVDLKFVIMYSGFMIDTSKGSGNEHYSPYYVRQGNHKALHVMGELDTVVSEERVMKLYDHTTKYSTLLKHPGSHFVPNSKLYVDQVTNWILSLDKEEEKEQKPKEDDVDDLLEMMDSIGKV